MLASLQGRVESVNPGTVCFEVGHMCWSAWGGGMSIGDPPPETTGQRDLRMLLLCEGILSSNPTSFECNGGGAYVFCQNPFPAPQGTPQQTNGAQWGTTGLGANAWRPGKGAEENISPNLHAKCTGLNREANDD